MIPLEIARSLRDAGLRWTPSPGDRFAVGQPEMAGEVFTLSDMVADVHHLPDGTVIGFNGTVEWALDSVDVEHTVWLPSESQLRELLGAAFRSLERRDDGWTVTTVVAGRPHEVCAAEPAEAYARALLQLISAATT